MGGDGHQHRDWGGASEADAAETRGRRQRWGGRRCIRRLRWLQGDALLSPLDIHMQHLPLGGHVGVRRGGRQDYYFRFQAVINTITYTLSTIFSLRLLGPSNARRRTSTIRLRSCIKAIRKTSQRILVRTLFYSFKNSIFQMLVLIYMLKIEP